MFIKCRKKKKYLKSTINFATGIQFVFVRLSLNTWRVKHQPVRMKLKKIDPNRLNNGGEKFLSLFRTPSVTYIRSNTGAFGPRRCCLCILVLDMTNASRTLTNQLHKTLPWQQGIGAHCIVRFVFFV